MSQRCPADAAPGPPPLPPPRLCAVMLDTLGRELMIKRKYGVDENGWPGIFEQLRVTKGQKVGAGGRAGRPGSWVAAGGTIAGA